MTDNGSAYRSAAYLSPAGQWRSAISSPSLTVPDQTASGEIIRTMLREWACRRLRLLAGEG
jgi:hypothetical protein